MDAFDASLPNVQAELATGKAFVHTETDRYGRPVVVIRVRQHVVGACRCAVGGAGFGGRGGERGWVERCLWRRGGRALLLYSPPAGSRQSKPTPKQPSPPPHPPPTHTPGEYPIEDSKRLAGHVLDQAIAALPPGGEQIMGIFDLRGFELKNADLQFAAFIIEAFFEYYPRRCAAGIGWGWVRWVGLGCGWVCGLGCGWVVVAFGWQAR